MQTQCLPHYRICRTLGISMSAADPRLLPYVEDPFAIATRSPFKYVNREPPELPAAERTATPGQLIHLKFVPAALFC